MTEELKDLIEAKFNIVYLADEGEGKDKNFIYEQSTPAKTWLIKHSLNKYPSLILFDNEGNFMLSEIKYINTEEIIINFNSEVAEKAILN